MVARAYGSVKTDILAVVQATFAKRLPKLCKTLEDI